MLQVEEYQTIVVQAQLQELRQAEVILATCSAAASPRMALGTNVKQVSQFGQKGSLGFREVFQHPRMAKGSNVRQVSQFGQNGLLGFREVFQYPGMAKGSNVGQVSQFGQNGLLGFREVFQHPRMAKGSQHQTLSFPLCGRYLE